MEPSPNPQVLTASRETSASPATLFELIADPARQPQWDGNDNLQHAPEGQRVRGVGDVFRMTLTSGGVRENHVTEFDEGRLIAWRPSDENAPPAGHLWRWELTPLDGRTRVTQTYDWTDLADTGRRLERAQVTTVEMLQASVDRLIDLAERLNG